MGNIVDYPSSGRYFIIKNIQKNSNQCSNSIKSNKIQSQLQKQQDHEQKSMKRIKRDIMNQKRFNNFQKRILQGYNDILHKQQLAELILYISQQIENGIYQDYYKFQGVGNMQSWNGLYKDGLIQWITYQKQQNRCYYNLYDMISLCFNFQYKKGAMTKQNIINWYQMHIQQNSKRFQLRFGLACFLYNTKNFKLSLKYFQSCLQIEPNFAKTHQYIAWIYAYWFDFQQMAIKYAKKSLQLDPINMTCQYILCLSQKNKVIRLQLLKKLIQKYPNYYRIYINLGEAQQQQSISSSYYKKSLQYDSNYTFAYFKLGDIERFNLRYDEAYKYYIKVKEINESEDYTYFYLGVLEEDKGNYQKAIELYHECLKMNPNNVDIYSAISSYYKNMYDNQKAFQYIHKQLQNNPYDYQTSNLIGIYYDQQNQSQKSIQFFKKSIQINGSYFQPYLNLGSSYQEKKEYQLAKNYYFKALQLKPQQSQVYYGIGICYGYTQQYDEAISWCNKCIQKGGDEDKQVYQYIGDMYCHKKMYSKSLQYYLQYCILNQQIHYDYILSNLITKLNREEARSIIQDNLIFYKDNLFAMANLGKLLVYLDQQDLAYLVYAQLSKEKTGNFKHRLISKEVERFYGRSIAMKQKYNKGIMSYSQKLALSRYKRQFNIMFQNLFS